MSRIFGFILFNSLSSATFRRKENVCFYRNGSLDIPKGSSFCHKIPTTFSYFSFTFFFFYLWSSYFLLLFHMKSLESLLQRSVMKLPKAKKLHDPAGTWRRNDILTSMWRHHVTLLSIGRHVPDRGSNFRHIASMSDSFLSNLIRRS